MADPRDRVGETESALNLVADEARRYLAELDDPVVRLPGADQAAAQFDGSLPDEGSGALEALRELIEQALERRGWDSVRVGWLVVAARPVTADDLAAARDLADDAGLLIEARDHREGLAALRWQATGVGMLLALGVLAMTVGLIRGETAGDLRTLTATGATDRTRRSIAAATSGALALLGALLGTLGAYVGLSAGYLHDLGALSPVPVLNLVAIAAGIPLVAAAGGWLLAGKEPRALARRPIA